MIGHNPLDGAIEHHLAAAVRGHKAIAAAVAEHAERDQLHRKIARERHDAAELERGAVGPGAGGAPGAADQH